MATFRANGVVSHSNDTVFTVGKKLRSVPFKSTITAAGATNGDVYILAGPMSYSSRVAYIKGSTPALTSANDCDLGFYTLDDDGTAVAIDADILWDGVDLSSALSYRELLATLNTSLDVADNIGTLLGLTVETQPVNGVFLALTINTKSTATTAVLDLEVVLEEATTL